MKEELSMVHSDTISLDGNWLCFQNITGICSSLTRTYCKAQSNFILRKINKYNSYIRSISGHYQSARLTFMC